MRDGKLRRRDLLRATPLAIGVLGLGGIGRFLVACSSDENGKLRGDDSTPKGPTPPTDDDEHVPAGENPPPPANAGDLPPTLPNQAWEARAKQLEDEQARVYGAVFSIATPGVFAGKERSHTPIVTAEPPGTYKKVKVLVEHVMGANGLDAGAVDAAKPDADAMADADADAARPDADAAADADADAGDAAKPDATPAPVHYITSVYLRADVNGKNQVVGLWEFQSTDPAPPSVLFTLPAGVTNVVAYEWCTLHGLWKTVPFPIP